MQNLESALKSTPDNDFSHLGCLSKPRLASFSSETEATPDATLFL